jgi:hypothetical protein
MYTVKLTYFKQGGKYYSEGEYETQLEPLHEIFDEVREIYRRKRLPGLMAGHSDFIVLIEVPDHPHDHPHLIGTRGE